MHWIVFQVKPIWSGCPAGMEPWDPSLLELLIMVRYLNATQTCPVCSNLMPQSYHCQLNSILYLTLRHVLVLTLILPFEMSRLNSLYCIISLAWININIENRTSCTSRYHMICNSILYHGKNFRFWIRFVTSDDSHFWLEITATVTPGKVLKGLPKNLGGSYYSKL